MVKLRILRRGACPELSRLALTATTRVLVGERQRDKQREEKTRIPRGGGDAKMETEIGEVWPQAKEAGRGQEPILPQSREGAEPCQNLAFRILASKTMRQHLFLLC